MQSQSLPDAASSRENEGTIHSESSIRPRFKFTKGRVLGGVLSLALAAIFVGSVVGEPRPPSHSNNNHPTNTTQQNSTSATPPTSPPQPPSKTPPRALTGREARMLGRRGLSVDTSSESYPKSYLVAASLIVLSPPSGIQKPDQFRIMKTRKCEGKVK